MKRLNILNLLKTAYVNVTKMIPLTDRLGTTLFKPLAMNSILAMGRIRRLARVIFLTKRFIAAVLEYNTAHGSTSTVKWLKAMHVALQKALGQDNLKSLRALQPGIPMPGLRSGLPRMIPLPERERIRRGHVPTIRFWSGLFNLYRVLQIPGELKLSTITAPFSGDAVGLQNLSNLSKELIFFDRLRGFENVRSLSLSPRTPVLSRSASPSNKMACLGYLTDIWQLCTHAPALWQELLYYLHAVDPRVTEFVVKLDEGYRLMKRLMSYDGIEFKGVKTGRPLYRHDSRALKDSLKLYGIGANKALSQFAVKEEAAGKIRLFALLDAVTQSCMSPLHDAMFALLKVIPNDGTFDQEASIRRSQDKAVKAGFAYSFDLTAATDRLPVVLSAEIIESIFQKEGMGESWRNAMVDRDFQFNPAVAGKLGLDPKATYRYAVGQPMGGLSSWPALALTHHWIVQLAAHRVDAKYTGWFTNYEILGDDIVIFDKLVADEYLVLMAMLGCEINLTKSISSHHRPVFEFAKRTCWGYLIVSGISLAQVRAGWRVSGRVANALHYASAGLLENSVSLLRLTLKSNAFSGGSPLSGTKYSYRRDALGVLSLLGERFSKGVVPLRVLMQALINPNYSEADLNGDMTAIPLKASLDVAYSALVDGVCPDPVPFSKLETRTEIFEEYESEISTTMLQDALKKAKDLYSNSELLLQTGSRRLYGGLYYLDATSLELPPVDDLPPEYQLLVAQFENYWNWMLGFEFAKENPEELYDELYALAYKHAKYNHVTFQEALDWVERVEGLRFKLELIDPVKPGETILESAPILATLRAMLKGVKPTWIDPVEFRELKTLVY